MAASVWNPGTQSAPTTPASQPFSFVPGTVALPGLNFVGNTNTGIYSKSAGSVTLASNGTDGLTLDASGNILVNNIVTGVEVDVASASTVDIGSVASNSIRVTGVVGINSFGTNYKGPKFIRFAAALTLNNSALLVCPGGNNISVNPGDSCIVVPKATAGVSSGWVIISYTTSASGILTAGWVSNSVGYYLATAALTSADFGRVAYYNSVTPGTLTLPAVLGNIGKIISVSNIGSGVCTIARNSADTINATGLNSVTSVNLYNGDSLALVTDGTNWIQVSGNVSSNVVAGLRNRIINGAMNIDQRNNGAAVVVTAYGAKLDRFAAANLTGAGTLTVQQSTMTGYGKSLKATATAAMTGLTTTNNVRACQQIIEAQNCFDLNGKAVTISFKAEINWTGNLAVAFYNSATTRSYVVNVAVVAGINTCSVVVPLEVATIATNDNAAGLNIDIGFCNEGTYQTATTGSWVAGLSSTSTTSTQWCKVTGNFVNITQVQLEQGSVATAFEQRPIGLELALCQRYYEVSGTSYIYSGNVATNISYYTAGGFKATKRVVPTMIGIDGGNSGFNAGVPSFSATVSDFFALKSAVSTVNGGFFQFSYAATAEYY